VRNRELKKLIGSEAFVGYILILPWIIGLLMFQFGPILQSFYLSFTKYNILQPSRFTGLSNYRRIFSDLYFIRASEVTFKYVLMTVPMKIIFAFIVALVLNMKLKGIALFRTIYYIPSIFGASIAMSILWKALFIYNGMVNQLLGVIGVKGPSWLGSPSLALFTISMLNVWQFGSSMVIFLAGLKQIPTELYEAARVDGAGKFACLLHVTIPGVAPLATFNILMQMIFAFQTFAAPYTIFDGTGGPLDSTLLYVIYLYRQGFKIFDMGYASTLSWMLLCMISVTAALIYFLDKKFVNYD